MRNVMIFAAVIAGLGTVMAQMADRMTPVLAHTAEQRDAPAVEMAASYSHTLNIPRDARGHFEAEGRINGQPIDFMVDTGASTIALNETSAASFGLRPTPGDYKVSVSTANGTVKAARTQIAMVDIGGLVVRNVDALVLPDEALSENLLGLSFLSRLKRFEYANGMMVLEQ